MKKENKTVKEFDKMFYKNHSTRQWLSRAGESYGSEHPQMGRAEILKFICKIEKEAYERGKADTQIVTPLQKKNMKKMKLGEKYEILG